MTGLEAILKQISDDAQREADEMLEQAKAEAEKIIAEAKNEAEKATGEIIAEGEARAESIKERAESAAQLERRNAMLKFKQQMIREAIDKTRESLENADDGEYFDTMVQLAVRFAAKGSAVMKMNRRDLDRLPTDFADRLKSAVPDAEITIDKKPCDIESGFILVYGGIDINCTLRAVFEAEEGELRDAVGKLFFPAV